MIYVDTVIALVIVVMTLVTAALLITGAWKR